MAADVRRIGYKAWINQQIDYRSVDDTVCDRILQRYFPWSGKTTKWLWDATGGESFRSAAFLEREQSVRQLFSNRQLHEQMVEFLSDLLYVGRLGKSESYVNEYNWMVLRTHALGKFRHALNAAITHPAMLIWLDNADSTATNLNENLGRELLELHTVGVGHYTEADVLDSARILTGHSRDWNTLSYRYRPENHAVGAVRVMGFRHENRSHSRGHLVLTDYLNYLARHRATAKRIARRLAVRFIDDEPSESLVSYLANVYQRSDTDLGEVVRRLFRTKAFWNSAGRKIRRPQEFVAAMVNAGDPDPTIQLRDPTWVKDTWANIWWYTNAITVAGHGMRGWPAVNGYPDRNEAWLTTHVLRTMWNTAEQVTNDWDDQIILRDQTWGMAVDDNAHAAARDLTLRLTGFVWSDADLVRIASWLVGEQGRTTPAPDRRIDRFNINHVQQAVRQVMASPYMLLR